MRASLILRTTHRTPLIKFLGKRTTPESIDHTPKAHPASPTHSLPDSFANYRTNAQQHGPLKGGSNGGASPGASPFQAPTSGSTTYGAIGGNAGRSLGPIQPKEGEYFDRNDLPKRFRRSPWSEEEMDAVSSGGASLFG